MTQTFPDWGFKDLITSNQTDIVSASLRVWREAGEMQLGITFAFATLPFVVMTMVYVRTRKLMTSTYFMLVTTILIHVFGLLHPTVATIIYILTGLMIALSITGIIGRK